jgi:lipopolysaccharide export system permease protein
MRLLDRYLLRELLLPLACCVIGFLVCFITFDMFNEMNAFQRNRLTATDILEYYGHRIPELVVASYIMPMALLLSLLYALTGHARHNELTAMRAAGISLGRISVPYFVVGLVFSGALFALNEAVVPDAVDACERVMQRHAPNQPRAAERAWKRNVMFVNDLDRRTWRIGAYHQQARIMHQPVIEWRQPGGSREEIYAERGRWANRRWVLTNVQRFEFTGAEGELPRSELLKELRLPSMIETPRLIQSEIKISSLESLRSLRKTQLSSAAILDYLQLHPQLDGRKSDQLLTMLHSRLAMPWTCLVVVLIAVPFGSLPGRRNVLVGVASSISICFVYFVAKDLALALGSGGYVAPWIAAWMPNVFFAVTGLVLMWRVR